MIIFHLLLEYMIGLLQSSIQAYCVNMKFNDCNTSDYNTSYQILMSQKGTENFGNYNLDKGIQEFLIGSSSGNVSFKISSFEFKFNNIQIINVDTENGSLVVEYPKDNTSNKGYVQLTLFNIYLGFEYTTQQQIYPYIYDSGNGSIYVDQAIIQFYAIAGTEQATDCYNYSHINIQLCDNSVTAFINKMDIKLSGQYSFLYNGILALLQDTITNLLNQQILPQLLTTGLTEGFAFMKESSPIVQPSQISGFNRNIVTGQDYQNFTLDQQFLTFKCGGQTYLYTDQSQYNYSYTAYGIPIDIDKQKQSVITNYDIMYYINIANFQSEFNNTKKLYQVQNQTQLNIECYVQNFVKTGILLQCADTLYQIKLSIITKIENDSRTLLTIKNEITEQIGCYKDDQIIYDTTQCSQYINLYKIKDLYENTVLNLYNSMGFDYCDIIFIDEQNMLVSCNIQKIIQ